MDPGIDQLTGWKIAGVASWLATTILGWLGVRTINRLDALRDVAVTRAELNNVLGQLREDRLMMHEENKQLLHRLENRMETLHRESNDRRHNLMDRVQELSLRIGQLGRQDP